MIKTVLYVPLEDNAGRPFGAEAWDALEADLFRFGRFTRVDGVHGVWRAGGATYRDTSRQYVVSLTSWTQLPAWLDVVRAVRDRFRQEAVYVEVAGVPEVIGAHGSPA